MADKPKPVLAWGPEPPFYLVQTGSGVAVRDSRHRCVAILRFVEHRTIGESGDISQAICDDSQIVFAAKMNARHA